MFAMKKRALISVPKILERKVMNWFGFTHYGSWMSAPNILKSRIFVYILHERNLPRGIVEVKVLPSNETAERIRVSDQMENSNQFNSPIIIYNSSSTINTLQKLKHNFLHSTFPFISEFRLLFQVLCNMLSSEKPLSSIEASIIQLLSHSFHLLNWLYALAFFIHRNIYRTYKAVPTEMDEPLRKAVNISMWLKK